MGKKDHKAMRSRKHKGMYSAQFSTTARNKIRRLTKRLAWDPTAASAIDRRKVQMIRGGQ